MAFSRAGRRRGTADPRGRLYYRQLDVVEWLPSADRPLVVLLEQVTEVMTVEEGRPQKEVRARLQRLGYVVEEHVLNSRDYGSVGQRVRLFTVGVRADVHARCGGVGCPAPSRAPRRRVRDIMIPFALRPKTHVVGGLRLLRAPQCDERTPSSYAGPQLLYRSIGRGYQWRVYTADGGAVTSTHMPPPS